VRDGDHRACDETPILAQVERNDRLNPEEVQNLIVRPERFDLVRIEAIYLLEVCPQCEAREQRAMSARAAQNALHDRLSVRQRVTA
jgi:hypothetical protein